MMAELVEEERREKEGPKGGHRRQRRRNRRVSDGAATSAREPSGASAETSVEMTNDHSTDDVVTATQKAQAPSLPRMCMDHFLCPITTEVMKDPVITVCDP